MRKYKHEGAHVVEKASSFDRLLEATTKETIHGKVGSPTPDSIMNKIAKKRK